MAKEEYLNHEYDIFEDVARSMAMYIMSGLLTAMIRRGRTAVYVKKLYEEMCSVFDTDVFFGKSVTMTDISKALTEDYNIDWEKLQPKLETREEFLHRMR